MAKPLNPHLHPVRPDLAAWSYKGQYKAKSYVRGSLKTLRTDIQPLMSAPSGEAGRKTEVLYGESMMVFEVRDDGWAWVQCQTDSYVGWLPASSLGEVIDPTHKVAVQRTFRYPEANLKTGPVGMISLGSQVKVTGIEINGTLSYGRLSDGSFVVVDHLQLLNTFVKDWVSIAEKLVGIPYLWGGRSTLGLDCSALVQMCAQCGGHALLRDAYMQEGTAGIALDLTQGLPELKRGDLIFWKGHVGILSDPKTLLHANGYTMSVAYETFDKAVERIRTSEFGEVTSIRRL
ncbi:C40 family peptidase [Flexibacterium corallicola]|uniref:C40 family peptidase n=1 Tax=Flexibacterium corallicola TaxID=3037259 RepID=UPI00286F7569|nr:NlpC/P60 family protein [Pseudovibrio sp. M1P-2-3]